MSQNMPPMKVAETSLSGFAAVAASAASRWSSATSCGR
jgi:hypothetical protein